MLAIIYIAAMIYFGDNLCRRFYRFSSAQHRFAAAFTVGLVLSSGISYLGAVGFAWTGQPLLAGNIVFAVCVAASAFISRGTVLNYPQFDIERPPGREIWDWVCLGICLLFGWWLMVTTLSYHDGNFQFGFKSWSDFGANLSLTQSFALGNNYPSEHPFFPGEPLRYHFLFWFQAANLSYLGLNVVWAINLLSIVSLAALLILIMTFTEKLFGSRAVSRLAVIFFFFPATSLAYLPFLQRQESFGGAFDKIFHSTQFLATGYPFRGEDWGGLTVAVFANQRQLIGGTAILFIVLIFLLDCWRQKTSTDFKSDTDESVADFSADDSDSRPADGAAVSTANETSFAPPQPIRESKPSSSEKSRFDVSPWIFSGLLIGALPYWNSAVFVAAAVLFGSLLLFLPCRRYLAFLIGTIIVIGLPQILLLRSGNLAPTTYSFFHWGFTIENPTVPLVVGYIAWTFGFKLILLLVAVWFGTGLQRRLLLAFSSLVAVVFLFQLSTDAFNNHKLLNIWNVFAAIYAAYALWRIGKVEFSTTVLAVILALGMITTSVIDLFPVYNDPDVVVYYENDRLTEWLLKNTKPDDIFLTQTVLSHQILFTGRRVFMANTLYAWTAGYDVGTRQEIYKQMFQELDPPTLLKLLQANKIAYVAIDDGVRNNDLLGGNLNAFVYQDTFKKVFVDPAHRYDNLVIYKIPLAESVDNQAAR